MEMLITPSGLDPATFRLAEQWLNQLPAMFVTHRTNIAPLLLHHLMSERMCVRVFACWANLLRFIYFKRCIFLPESFQLSTAQNSLYTIQYRLRFSFFWRMTPCHFGTKDQETRRHIPYENKLWLHHCKNIKSPT